MFMSSQDITDKAKKKRKLHNMSYKVVRVIPVGGVPTAIASKLLHRPQVCYNKRSISISCFIFLNIITM